MKGGDGEGRPGQEGRELVTSRGLCGSGWGGRCGLVGQVEHGSESGGKIGEAGAGNDDGVTVPVSSFGDAEKATALVFAKFDAEVLAFDLHLF